MIRRAATATTEAPETRRNRFNRAAANTVLACLTGSGSGSVSGSVSGLALPSEWALELARRRGRGSARRARQTATPRPMA
jgi:hypothetical protein